MESSIGTKDFAFRKICTERFVSSICYSLLQQYFLVTIFILLINFSFLHPINWLVGTIRVLFSFYPWIASIPLAVAVVLHGIVLAKTCLLETRYYSTHFLQCYHNLIRQSFLMITNGVIGFLMALLYTRFLRDEYRLLLLPSSHGDATVLNERLIYVTFSGLFGGCYFFLQEQFNPEGLDFAIILLPKAGQYWNSLNRTFPKAMKKSAITMLIYMCFYYTLSILFRSKVASLSSAVRLQEASTVYSFCSIVMDVRLLMYTWLFSVLVLCNMNLTNSLFRIFLNEPYNFTIETSTIIGNQDPLLADALTCHKIPVIQHLAAEDLFAVAEAHCSMRRKQLFALTVPGGHPKNWRKVYDVCMMLIRDFTRELNQSIGGIEPMPAPPMVLMGGVLRPTTSMDRERFLMKQYNQNFGIRSLSTPSLNPSNGSYDLSTKATNEKKGENKALSFAMALNHIPGYDYFFMESKSSKSCFLLSVQAQLIVKITQSLAAITARSLDEDTYGVLQNDLPSIVHALLGLKQVVDKIGTINLDVKKIDRNYIALKGAVKKSLYRFTTTFGPYIKHLIVEQEDLKGLQPFINFREV